MARRSHCLCGHATDLVGITIAEQGIELAAIALKLGTFIKDLAERFLH